MLKTEAGRLVIFSNRLPVGDNPSGGLVVAMRETMDAQGGLWIGTAGEPNTAVESRLTQHPGANFERLSMRLTHREWAEYYLGYANSVLWPICHGRPDLLDIRPEFFSTYKSVNARLAEMSVEHLRDDDVIWIHDYHLIPLAMELRKRGVKNKIGYFHHIPFPSAANIMAMSNFAELADWFVEYDLVGLQTQRDVAACLEVFRSLPGTQILLDGQLKKDEKTVRVKSFPISIDVDNFAEMAATAVTSRSRVLPEDHRLIIGVDRLDYSKGLPQRLRGFQQFLRARDDNQPLVSLLQISPPTRESVTAYSDIRRELESLSGEVNGEFADIGYTPVQYIHRAVPRHDLAGYYRRASIGLVTSLADGMNLVAKEYVAAQDPDNPGVLILSSFAGAYEQMRDHVVGINPYDSDAVAKGLSVAVSMPLEDRKQRHRALMKDMRETDIAWWVNAYLKSLMAA